MCLFFIGTFPEGVPQEVKVIQKLKAAEVGQALADHVSNADEMRAVPDELVPVSPTATTTSPAGAPAFEGS